ncbi:hypothetical protein THAOC_27930, partial [Thalassiosira oceanica]
LDQGVAKVIRGACGTNRAGFRISERGKIGCIASSSDYDNGGNGCGLSKADDDLETPMKFPNDNEDSRSEAESAIQSACRAIIVEEAAEPGRGVDSARRLLQYLENIRRHPGEERYRRLTNLIFRGGVYYTAALGVLEALGFEERDGHVEYVLDVIAGCDLGVSFAMQTVNEALEEMTRELAGEDKDALAARAKRLAAVEGRLTKQERRAMKAKKRSGKTPLRGPNSQYTMRWT